MKNQRKNSIFISIELTSDSNYFSIFYSNIILGVDILRRLNNTNVNKCHFKITFSSGLYYSVFNS